MNARVAAANMTPTALEAETSNLVQAMMYTTNQRSNSSGSSINDLGASAHCKIPPPIQNAWKQLQSPPLLLDKLSLIKFLIPTCAQPHTGSGGHMGLFDCLTYALRTTSTSSGKNNSGTYTTLSSLVSLPDICIFLAICQQYSELQMGGGPASSSDDSLLSCDNHPDVIAMAKWMFCVYASYEKKNLVSRDTVHRFLSDVHGEESYKTLAMREFLDEFFESSPSLTQTEFVQAVLDTILFEPQPSHVLLDWMAILAAAIKPLPLNTSEMSTQSYLDAIDKQSRLLPQVCDTFHLAENRLFEIKRRFHSLVERTTTVIQGDPMSVEEEEEEPAVQDGESSTQQPLNNVNQGSHILPKHIIQVTAFVQAVSDSSDELGHAGYLHPQLAKLVFEGVAARNTSNDQQGSLPQFWDLVHLLEFGGMCVRSIDDVTLIEWTIWLFGDRENKEEQVLSRKQVSVMLAYLCAQKEFRTAVDKPVMNLEDAHCFSEDVGSSSQVSMTTASSLGLCESASTQTNVELDSLVTAVFSSVGCHGGKLTARELLCWHNETPREGLQRLRIFFLELQIMSSVLFGIPPKRASMEKSIISEIQRRHELRYPLSESSRRGPKGTVWYLIDDKWLKTWSATIETHMKSTNDCMDFRDKGNENVDPRGLSRIANRRLLQEDGSLALRIDIEWRKDYDIVPPLVWSALQAWYDGGPPIHRSVVPYSSRQSASSASGGDLSSLPTENEIELYPFFVTMYLCDAASRGDARPFQQHVPVSRVSPVRVLLEQLCRGLGIDPAKGRLWMMGSAGSGSHPPVSKGDWLLDVNQNIIEQRKKRVTETGRTVAHLLIEIRDEETGLWPRGDDGKSRAFNRAESRTMDTGDGIVGLFNMGNTCYLNSSIQCLSHTPIFRDYFNSKSYLKDINTTNPLGHEGRLAQVSAVLINSLWKRFKQQGLHQPKRVTAPGSYAPINAPSLTPKTFKDSLGKFNDIFQGNEQHDAQELLAFLLAGLSEDLNRIVDKPYIEAPDSDGRPDSELADIWWSNHLKREVSIIVALFTGQYKSLLKCKTCKYESARFEPFSFLQLPLPEDDTVPVNLILYPSRNDQKATKYTVRIHNAGSLYDVLVGLAKVLYADEGGDEVSHEVDDPDGDPEKLKLQTLYAEKAKNMAVVDMRDGYISKIAPNAWRLPALQNKDTGELPLLHVYDLDPLPETMIQNPPKNGEHLIQNTSNEIENADSGEDDEEELSARIAFLAVAQRRSEAVAKDLLHPLRHRVFGTPLLLRIVDLESLTGNRLYDVVAQHLRNVVHVGALPFLESGFQVNEDQEQNEEKKEDVNKSETRMCLQKTLSDMEQVAAGGVPRYGFRLRLASRDGKRCALCPWFDCCIGCLIPDCGASTVAMNGDSIIVDWHFVVDVATNGFGHRTVFQEQSNHQNRSRRYGTVAVKNHPSCGIGKKNGHAGAINLEDCLDAFAKEENIPEAYCSNCQEFRLQTKRMSLWRLSPIVIIHLKRFQFTQASRRKLRDFVNFPLEGLDLSRIVAQDTTQRGENVDSIVSEAAGEEGEEEATVEESEEATVEEGERATGEEGETHEDSTFIQTPMNQDDGRSETLYDLYGVVHHQGALSGGHYVASLKSEIDGQWRLFNDAQIYEVHSRDVVDSSAYILFYIRRDVKGLKLEDLWSSDLQGKGSISEDEMNTLISNRSDRCSVS